MTENKTKESDASVDAFLDAVENDERRTDCKTLLNLMAEVTGSEPRMWGSSMIGFGSYHYRYASGREGDWFITGFSPRKKALTLYIMPGFDGYDDLMGRLGKHTSGKACIYVRRLDDIDLEVLKEMVLASVLHMRAQYG